MKKILYIVYIFSFTQLIAQQKSTHTKYILQETKYLYYLIFSLTLLSISYLIWSHKKSKISSRKLDEVVEKFEKEDFEEQKKSEFFEIENSLTQIFINNEIETKILKKLDTFERKQNFLSPKISVASLASDLNTNVTYLSSIIKKHKDQNFNGYLNELRINYLIDKLKSDPTYLKYKITHLTEICGFTSYSTFRRVFSQQVGMSLSEFLFLINKENSYEDIDNSMFTNKL